jgi:hypothetical protein
MLSQTLLHNGLLLFGYGIITLSGKEIIAYFITKLFCHLLLSGYFQLTTRILGGDIFRCVFQIHKHLSSSACRYSSSCLSTWSISSLDKQILINYGFKNHHNSFLTELNFDPHYVTWVKCIFTYIFFSLPPHPDHFWSPPSILFSGYQGLFPWG